MNKQEEQFLFFYMQQSWEEMRHLENLRERVSVLILTIASIIAGFVVQQEFEYSTKIMAWIIIALGIVGIAMSLKIFQIHQMGQKRLNKWYEYLEKQCGENPQILALKREADKENKSDFKILSKIPHNVFWTILNVSIIVLGIVMLNLVKPKPEPKANIEDHKQEIINHKKEIESSKELVLPEDIDESKNDSLKIKTPK